MADLPEVNGNGSSRRLFGVKWNSSISLGGLGSIVVTLGCVLWFGGAWYSSVNGIPAQIQDLRESVNKQLAQISRQIDGLPTDHAELIETSHRVDHNEGAIAGFDARVRAIEAMNAVIQQRLDVLERERKPQP